MSTRWQCPRCRAKKPPAEFYAKQPGSDGAAFWCKHCAVDYALHGRSKVFARDRNDCQELLNGGMITTSDAFTIATVLEITDNHRYLDWFSALQSLTTYFHIRPKCKPLALRSCRPGGVGHPHVQTGVGL